MPDPKDESGWDEIEPKHLDLASRKRRDLRGDDRQIHGHRSPDAAPGATPGTVRSPQQYRAADAVLGEIENMRDSGKFRFAANTLDGIATTISETMYVTPGQRRALNNIRRAAGWEELED